VSKASLHKCQIGHQYKSWHIFYQYTNLGDYFTLLLHWIGAWVGLTDSLEVMMKREIPPLLLIDPRTFCIHSR
jgi:hypothetical protein